MRRPATDMAVGVPVLPCGRSLRFMSGGRVVVGSQGWLLPSAPPRVGAACARRSLPLALVIFSGRALLSGAPSSRPFDPGRLPPFRGRHDSRQG